ncbi:reverse transcriptase/ribonuclease h/methyltransferase [Plakobranchus ocellatus]|uniref:Reverse transcriptase/ribonuclease h/methyltransferase n=1 Tax=Plakobranchus ocellatus TaxID=259542 RepID=A0AAV4CZ85_9GAST|nr:reverse transcriptase/ribonuclease h/methyltransferase [Plakobranchus ocellatus]
MYTALIASLPLAVICLLQTDAPNLSNNRSRSWAVEGAATQTNQTYARDLERYAITQGNEIQTSRNQLDLEKPKYEETSTLSSSAKTNEEMTEQKLSHGTHTNAFVKQTEGLDRAGSDNSTQKSATNIFYGIDGENSSRAFVDLSPQEKISDGLKEETYDARTYESRAKPYSNFVTSYPVSMSNKSLPPVHLQNEVKKSLAKDGVSKNETGKDDTELLKLREQLPLNNSISENGTVVAANPNENSFVHGQVKEIPSPSDDNDIDMAVTFTCEGRCDNKMSFPCSCSATCVFYGTCCENLSLDCPRVWEKGQFLYDQIRGSAFVCDADLKIYKIVSCPGLIGSKEVGSSNSETPMMGIENAGNNVVNTTPETKDSTMSISTSLTEADKQIQEPLWQRLIKALTAGPFTDSNTGLTFTSKAIYDCLGMSPKTAMPWSLKFRYNSISPIKLEDVDDFQHLEEYYPEFDKNIFKAHLCLPNLIDTCKPTADIEKVSERNENKCKNITAIVSSSDETRKFYRNRFCAYCNEETHRSYALLTTNRMPMREPELFVLMSMSDSKFNFELIMHHALTRDPFPWTQAQCSLPDPISISTGLHVDSRSSESGEPSICSATCGDSRFTLGSDGVCRARHLALLAVADDGLTRLCPSAVTGLAKFLACGLKSEIKNLQKADVGASSVTVMFDSTFNKSLYVVKSYMALARQSGLFFSNSLDDTIPNVRHVALLVKSLRDYRLSQTLCPEIDENIENDFPKTIQTTSLIRRLKRLMWDVDFFKSMQQLRGPIVDNQTTTTVCLSPVYDSYQIEEVDPKHLGCIDDPVYERDADWITKFHDSPCFSHFENLQSPGANGAISMIKDRGTLLVKKNNSGGAQDSKRLTTSLRADNRAYKHKKGENSFLGEQHSHPYRRWKTNHKSFKMKSTESRFNKGRKQSHLLRDNASFPIAHGEAALIITSDASLERWNAICDGIRAGGAWTTQEINHYHINEMELLGALFAVKSFTKSCTYIHIRIYLGNTTAIWALASRVHLIIWQQTWQVCIGKHLWQSAAHIPGTLNTIADSESRNINDETEWMLNESLLTDSLKILEVTPNIDLFASRLNFHFVLDDRVDKIRNNHHLTKEHDSSRHSRHVQRFQEDKNQEAPDFSRLSPTDPLIPYHLQDFYACFFHLHQGFDRPFQNVLLSYRQQADRSVDVNPHNESQTMSFSCRKKRICRAVSD